MKLRNLLIVFAVLFLHQKCDIRDRYIYSTWDEDKNEIISKNEFITLFVYNDYFKQWDEDNDKYISKEEYQNAVENYLNRSEETIPVFNEWDKNDNFQIDESEFADTLYDVWDDNGNYFIEEEEFNKWSKYE